MIHFRSFHSYEGVLMFEGPSSHDGIRGLANGLPEILQLDFRDVDQPQIRVVHQRGVTESGIRWLNDRVSL